MAHFVELTHPSGHAMLFNMDNVNFIVPLRDNSPSYANGARSAIGFANGTVEYMTETAREVLKIVENG